MTEFIGGALAMLDGGYWLPLLFNTVLKGSLVLLLAACIRRLLKGSSASIRHALEASALIALLALPLMWALLPAWHVPFLSSPPTFVSTLAPPGPVARQGPPNQRISQPALQHQALAQSAVPTGASPPEDRTAAESAKTGLSASTASADARTERASSRTAASQLRDGKGQTAHEPAVRPQPYESVWQTSVAWLQARWPAVLVGLWMLGAAIFLLRLLYAMLGIWWLASRSKPCSEAEWLRTADQVRSRMGVARRVRLVFSDHLEVALSLGLWKPVIVLPSEARRWNRARLESILLHEMAHVRRWDNVFNVLAQVATAFYWFHPLAWWLQSRLTVDREQACDDAVLAAGTRAPDYAQHLLQVARAVLPMRRRLLKTVEVSQSSALKDRLEAILEKGRNRTALGGLGSAVMLLALLMAAPLAVLRPWADEGISLSRQSKSARVVKRTSQEAAQPQAAGHGGPGFRVEPTRPSVPWEPPVRASSPSYAAAGQDLAESGFQADGPEVVSVEARLAMSAGVSRADSAWASAPEIPPRSGLPLADSSRLTFTGIAFPGRGGDGSPADPVGDPGNRAEDPGTPQTPERPGDGGSEPQDPEPEDPRPENPRNPDPEDPPDGGESETGMDTVMPDGVQGPFGQALDVNDNGTTVGIATTEQGEFRPFVWDERSGMRLLDTLGGFGGGQLVYGINRWGTSAARAVAVNDRDQVIGISTDAQGRVRSFFWSESTGMLDLGDLGGGETQVRALNERGQAVGFSLTAQGRRRAFIWTLEDGLRDMGGDASLSSEAYDINDVGQTVGEIGFRAFIWQEEAGMFRLASEEIIGSGQAVNNSGAVAGWAIFQRGSPRRAFLWTPQGGLEDLGTLGEDYDSSRAVAINEEGIVLGSSSTPPNPFLGTQTQRAFFWIRGRGMTDIDAYGGGGEHVPELALNNDRQVASRLPANPLSGSIQSYMWTPDQGTVLLAGQEEEEFHISSPTALNDLGEVAGTALVSSDDPVFGNVYHPVIWRPANLERPQEAAVSPFDDLRETLDAMDERPGSDAREVLNARLSSADRKLGAGQVRQARIDLFRLAVLAERAVLDQELFPAQGRRLIEEAVTLMNVLTR